MTHGTRLRRTLLLVLFGGAMFLGLAGSHIHPALPGLPHTSLADGDPGLPPQPK
jgi:hypothetical protein